MNIGENLHKLVMAGVGAANLVGEESQKVVESLAERGEAALQQGKELNEKLRHDIKDAVNAKDEIKVKVGDEARETVLDLESLLAMLEKLPADALNAVRAKLDQLQAPKAADEGNKTDAQ